MTAPDALEMPRVVQVIPDLGLGGAERMLLNLVSELRATHRVTVVSLWPPIAGSPVETELAEAEVEVVHLDKKPGVDLAAFGSVSRALDRLAPDVVHTHRMAVRYILPWTLRRRSVRHVHTVHTLAQHEGTNADRVALGRVYRSGRVIATACGPLVASSLQEVYGIDPPIVDNGIAPHFFNEWQRPEASPGLQLVCLARLTEVKNHALLLRAVARAVSAGANITLELAGDGPLRGDLERLSAALGLAGRVRFLGQVSDVSEVLRRADVSVLTSRYEGAPLSVMEAMAMGVPVLAHDVGGLPHLLCEGGGWLFDGTTDHLTTELLRLAGSPDEVRRVAGDGMVVARERYSASAMAEGYRALYRSNVAVRPVDPRTRGMDTGEPGGD